MPTLPSQNLLEQVSQKIKQIPNKRGEFKRQVHYGCYLLCYKSGLRISEAIKFNLAKKTKQGLYRIDKPKGKHKRYVYVAPSVISELRKIDWQPNQTNRFAFYHFLKKVKRELDISKSIELTPHTLRRAFTTYHAENGVSLPLLQKMLGHSSIRTTALYWKNIYTDPNKEISNILTPKNWLQRKEAKAKVFNTKSVVIPKPQPSKTNDSLLTISTYQQPLLLPKKDIKKQIPIVSEFFAETIARNKHDSKELTTIANQKEKQTILLAKIKYLEQKLTQVQAENNKLRIAKEQAQQLANQEKERANHYQHQLKTIRRWQKLDYYQHLVKEQQEMESKVVQLPKVAKVA